MGGWCSCGPSLFRGKGEGALGLLSPLGCKNWHSWVSAAPQPHFLLRWGWRFSLAPQRELLLYFIYSISHVLPAPPFSRSSDYGAQDAPPVRRSH